MTDTIPAELDPSNPALERLRFVQEKSAASDPDIMAHVENMRQIPGEDALWGAWMKGQDEDFDAANDLLDTGIARTPDMAELHYLKAHFAEKTGDMDTVERAAQRACELHQDYTECHILLCLLRLTAPEYPNVLGRIHKHLKPKTYLEIGVFEGMSLRLARAAQTVIGVDPDPRYKGEKPERIEIVEQTSDDFFAEQADHRFADSPIDFAFVDGLHHANQALRDILNTERYMQADGTIAVHDIIPLNAVTAQMRRQTTFWSGDVWKTWFALQKFCPDLKLATIDAPPTGLGLIRGLNPDRNLTDADLDEMYAYMGSIDFSLLGSPVKSTPGLTVMPWSHEGLIAFLSR